MKCLMFSANQRRYVIRESDVIESYPVKALNAHCLITKNGKSYNATDITEIHLEIFGGEIVLTDI